MTIPRLPPAELAPDHLTFFVYTKLVNELNAREHWGARKRRAQDQRDATATAVYAALHSDPTRRWTIESDPAQPKAVTLVAHVFNLFDSHDGLRAACKHVVDGLADARLIQDDADRHGHSFAYEQLIDRQRLGVLVTVRLRESARRAESEASA